MAPILYHVPGTISSPIVQCLIELEPECNPVQIMEITFADLKSAEYLAINPMGTSPAFQDKEAPSFQDDGIVLWESGAILDYLLEQYDSEAKLSPTNVNRNSEPERIAARAKYLHLKQFIIATVYPFLASLFVEKLKPEEQQDADYVESAIRKWKSVIGPVLVKWLGDAPYYLGTQVSAVDILLCKPLNNAQSMSLLEDFPALKALFARISARPSFARAYESRPLEQDNEDTRSILLIPNYKSVTI